MKSILTFFFALLIHLTLFSQVSEKEKNALVDFYTATQGDQWNKKWNLNNPVSNWSGVTIENGHVTEIRMLFNNLNGPLTASLNNLTELRVLELSFNKLKGEIPTAIGSLNNLEVLALNGNNLIGTIPNSIGNLKKLKQLHLSSNQLTGNLPNEVNQLTNLEIFNVFDNNFTGDLPLGLTKNRNLKIFLFAENNFNHSTEISTTLLINSGGMLDLKESTLLNPSAGKAIIAIEISDDEN